VSAHPPKTGAIVASQLRCEGYLCPQWALDLSRYDTIRYVNDSQQFEYRLAEHLPLAPTKDRSFNQVTAYDEETREYTIAMSNYPIQGVDSIFVSLINDYANESTPVSTNLLIAHPDAKADHPGSRSLNRILYGPKHTLFAIFDDASIYQLDTDAKQYNYIAKLFDSVDYSLIKDPVNSLAHVFDGYVLKSFIRDADANNYLVKADFSDSTSVKVTKPVKLVSYIKGSRDEYPLNAFMIATNPTMTPQLMVVLYGSTGGFDQFNFVDEETGVMTPIISNLADYNTCVFECYSSTKDCDMWTTSAYDKANYAVYFQCHVYDDGSKVSTTSMMKLGFTQNHVTGLWYAYVNPAESPMNFGYSGYQYVTIKQD